MGHHIINVKETPCDVLCAPTHKGIFGIQGGALFAVVAALIIVVVSSYIEPLSIADVVTLCCYILLAILIVAFVTLVTIGNKIYRVSRINAADVIKSE